MKILFSTTLGPYREQYFNTSPTDVFNQRFSRGDGIFSMQGHLHMQGLHVIAQNISAPSIVLEYPRREDFIAEIKKGYDYVGISSFHNQVPSVIEMCELTRKYAPGSKIVLGGYGAVGIESCLPIEERNRLCDYICHEEGARYMRKLLGEDPSAPMQQSHLPRWALSMPMLSGNFSAELVPVVVGSLGCINGCDFCGTTEMFKQRRVEMLSPEQVYAEFRRAWEENPMTPNLTLLEEDSYMNKEYISEVGRLLREDKDFGLAHYNFYCLSSNKAFSQWKDFDDIMLTGISNVFIGVESKFAQDEGYNKRKGRTIDETFRDLHRRGIATTGAWMAGFDFQTPENIEEDLAYFISLQPTMQQLTRLCPFPATKMWLDMKEQNRIREDVQWEEISFFGGGGVPAKNFTEEQMMSIIDNGYKRLYETWGPTMARQLDVALKGYEHCTAVNKNRYYRDRAKFHKRMASTTFPLIKAMEIYAPNNIVRKRMKDLQRDYARLIGEPTKAQKAMSQAIVGAAGFKRFIETFYPHENNIREEPFSKYIYHKKNKPGESPYKRVIAGESAVNNGLRKVQSSLTGMMWSASGLTQLAEKITPFRNSGQSIAPQEIVGS